MKKLIVFVNIAVFIIFIGHVLFTLTYAQVPVEYQHLWFGDDLHTYLIFEHTLSLVCYVIFFIILNGTFLLSKEDK